MRELTSTEVEKYASVKGGKRIAIENFLSTLDTSIGVMGNTMNAQMDARMYKWNTVTIRAIEAGIRAAGKPKEVGKFGTVRRLKGSEKSIETQMIAKGYMYKLSPTKKEFEPLYAKTHKQIAEIHRSYPNVRFKPKSLLR